MRNQISYTVSGGEIVVSKETCGYFGTSHEADVMATLKADAVLLARELNESICVRDYTGKELFMVRVRA